MKLLRYIVASLLLASTASVAAPVITLYDPPGDDFGNRTLSYPQRPDLSPGDLDLRLLSVRHEEEGYWFEAEFTNIIRDPTLIAGERFKSILNSARRGFYAFNIDIYIDLDRKSGAGNQFTLPGRKTRIAPEFAWERAVILTPDPESARAELLGVLLRQFADKPPAEAVAAIDQTMYFARKVRVRDRRISFFVPASFFAGASDVNWAVTAFVTAAKPHDDWAINPVQGAATKPEDHDMGVLQPIRGSSADAFGYVGDIAPSPVIDLIAPTVESQVTLLSLGQPLAGAAMMSDQGLSYPKTPAFALDQARNPVARNGRDEDAGWFRNALGSLFGLSNDRPKVRPPSAGQMSLGDMLDPGGASATVPSPAIERALLEPALIKQRLAELKAAFDARRINQTEYDAQRQQILDQL